MKKKIFLMIVASFLALLVFWPAGREQLRGSFLGFGKPFLSINSKAGFEIKQFFSFFFQMKAVEKQNKELIDQLQQLEVDRSQISELANENKLLKQELGYLGENTGIELVPAKIIGREPTAFLDYVIIDKGKEEGLAEKMAVLSNGILIGQISETSDHTSKVTLVTSKDSLIQAMLEDSRATGVLRGGLSGLFLDNIVSDTDYESGENVVTSGLGGEVKAGILIGKAGRIQSHSSEIFKNIEVISLVDFSKLEMVFVEK